MRLAFREASPTALRLADQPAGDTAMMGAGARAVSAETVGAVLAVGACPVGRGTHTWSAFTYSPAPQATRAGAAVAYGARTETRPTPAVSTGAGHPLPARSACRHRRQVPARGSVADPQAESALIAEHYDDLLRPAGSGRGVSRGSWQAVQRSRWWNRSRRGEGRSVQCCCGATRYPNRPWRPSRA